MKRLMTLMVLGVSSLVRAEVVCEVPGSAYRCYKERITLTINEQNKTFAYSSYFDIAGQFCGWPPAGSYFEGVATKNGSTYSLIGTHGEIADLKLEGSKGIYHGPGGEFTMSCRYQAGRSEAR